MRITLAVQRTGEVSWARRFALMQSGSVSGAAVTFWYMGQRGVLNGVASMASASSRRAGSMRGEWKAPPTGSGKALFAPASLQAAQAADTDSVSPEMTIWPGELKLAGTTMPGTSPQMRSTSSSARPIIAAMAPGWASQHFCIAPARTATRRRPSSNDTAPAATRALNSPSE